MSKKNVKVLIVEDELEIAQMLSVMLEDYFEEIFIAHNGSEGLKTTREIKDLACVLSDINMPVMDGIQMVKNIRGDGNQVPVIFFTGYGTDAAMREALKYGIFDFVHKPGFDDLEDIVQKAVASNFEKSKDSDKNLMNDCKKLLDKS